MSCCYGLNRGDHESIIVNGVGIRPGDRFVFFHSDAGNALTRVDDARRSLEALDVDQAVSGARFDLLQLPSWIGVLWSHLRGYVSLYRQA